MATETSETAAIGPDVRAIAEEIGRLYPAVYRRFHVSHQAIPGADVTPRMLGVLQHLFAAGPLTLGELTQHTGLSKSAVTELADRLEAKGLIARMRDERDHRRVFLWLTDVGRERASQHPQVLGDDALAQAVARMRPADREALVRGLRALLEIQDMPKDRVTREEHSE